MMKSVNTQVPLNKSLFFGTISGFIGGIVMEVPMTSLALMLGMPADSFLSLIGLLFGATPNSAFSLGMGFHSFVSIIVGMIFALGVHRISRFHVSSYRKGIKYAMIPGMVAFVVIGLPLIFVFIPPVMMHMFTMMNPQMTHEMALEQVSGLIVFMTIGAFIAHVFYGLALGAVYSFLQKKSTTSNFTGGL